eukprot:361545-Chlamydomonas_euryale.AAC.3
MHHTCGWTGVLLLASERRRTKKTRAVSCGAADFIAATAATLRADGAPPAHCGDSRCMRHIGRARTHASGLAPEQPGPPFPRTLLCDTRANAASRRGQRFERLRQDAKAAAKKAAPSDCSPGRGRPQARRRACPRGDGRGG